MFHAAPEGSTIVIVDGKPVELPMSDELARSLGYVVLSDPEPTVEPAIEAPPAAASLVWMRPRAPLAIGPAPTPEPAALAWGPMRALPPASLPDDVFVPIAGRDDDLSATVATSAPPATPEHSELAWFPAPIARPVEVVEGAVPLASPTGLQAEAEAPIADRTPSSSTLTFGADRGDVATRIAAANLAAPVADLVPTPVLLPPAGWGEAEGASPVAAQRIAEMLAEEQEFVARRSSEESEAARVAGHVPIAVAIEADRAQESARLAEEARAEEWRAAEEAARLAEDARLAEEWRAAEAARLAEDARVAEDERLAEEWRVAEDARLAEELRAAEDARLAEEWRAAEDARLAEEWRAAEEARAADEALAYEANGAMQREAAAREVYARAEAERLELARVEWARSEQAHAEHTHAERADAEQERGEAEARRALASDPTADLGGGDDAIARSNPQTGVAEPQPAPSFEATWSPGSWDGAPPALTADWSPVGPAPTTLTPPTTSFAATWSPGLDEVASPAASTSGLAEPLSGGPVPDDVWAAHHVDPVGSGATPAAAPVPTASIQTTSIPTASSPTSSSRGEVGAPSAPVPGAGFAPGLRLSGLGSDASTPLVAAAETFGSPPFGTPPLGSSVGDEARGDSAPEYPIPVPDARTDAAAGLGPVDWSSAHSTPTPEPSSSLAGSEWLGIDARLQPTPTASVAEVPLYAVASDGGTGAAPFQTPGSADGASGDPRPEAVVDDGEAQAIRMTLPTPGPDVLVAKNLIKRFRRGGRTIEALAGVDITLRQGEIVTITGPSGSGKSTLLACLAGLDRVDAGEVVLHGERLSTLTDGERAQQRAEHMGFVFSSNNLVPVFTAVENVEVPLLLSGWSGAEARAEALAVLEFLGLADRAEHLPTELSAGEQQRVAIGRAVAGRPQIIWADEPTASLDEDAAVEVVRQLLALNRNGATVVVVTHDPEVAELAHRRITMRNGRIAEITDFLQGA